MFLTPKWSESLAWRLVLCLFVPSAIQVVFIVCQHCAKRGFMPLICSFLFVVILVSLPGSEHVEVRASTRVWCGPLWNPLHVNKPSALSNAKTMNHKHQCIQYVSHCKSMHSSLWRITHNLRKWQNITSKFSPLMLLSRAKEALMCTLAALFFSYLCLAWPAFLTIIY